MVIFKGKFYLEAVSVLLSEEVICIHSGAQQSDAGCEEAGTEEENDGGDKWPGRWQKRDEREKLQEEGNNSKIWPKENWKGEWMDGWGA